MADCTIARVLRQPAQYYPAKELQDMSLEEITKKYIRTCGKANGQVSVCSKCQSPCAEGKRAIQLVANKVYNDPPIPLYGGKTLIQKAQEENMRRREQMEKEKAKEEKPKYKKYMRWEGWWEESLASGDQVKWIMDNMDLTRTKAKNKIYMYKYTHGLITVPEIKEPVVTPASEVKIEKTTDANIESKLDVLLKKQEEYKNEMIKYQNLYNEAQKKYEEIKKKADILCSAMDILNG